MLKNKKFKSYKVWELNKDCDVSYCTNRKGDPLGEHEICYAESWVVGIIGNQLLVSPKKDVTSLEGGNIEMFELDGTSKDSELFFTEEELKSKYPEALHWYKDVID